jgi:hypothetical protein
MATWHALFEEDAYSRGFIFLQNGDDEGTREVFDTIPSEQVEDPGFERQLGQLMTVAKDEIARRNAYEDRREISAALARKIADQSGI